MLPLGCGGHTGPGGSLGEADHGCSAGGFQAVLHGRVILISQCSELSSLLGIQQSQDQSITCPTCCSPHFSGPGQAAAGRCHSFISKTQSRVSNMSFGGAGTLLWGRGRGAEERGGGGALQALKHEDVKTRHPINITGLLCVFYSTVRPIQAGSAQSMYQPWTQGPSSQEAETSPASSSCCLRQNNPAGSLLCHGGLSSWLFPHWISLFPFWQEQ